MTTINVPLSPFTSSIPLLICLTLGLANTFPQIEASRRPEPTNPAWDGSWPEPPPEIRETWEGEADVEVLKMTVREECEDGCGRNKAWSAGTTADLVWTHRFQVED